MKNYRFTIEPEIKIGSNKLNEIKINSKSTFDAVSQFSEKMYLLTETQRKLTAKGTKFKIINESKNYKINIYKEDKIILQNFSSKLFVKTMDEIKHRILDYFLEDNLSITKDFNIVNPFGDNQIELALNIDFNKRKIKKIHSINTIFSDFEAFSICNGLNVPRARKIARKYFETQNLENVAEAHIYAMEAFKNNPTLIPRIIAYPPVPFGSLNVIQIFTELDNRRIKKSNPSFKFLFQDAEEKSKIEVAFYKEKIDGRILNNRNVITVTNLNSNSTILKLSRCGKIIPKNNTKKIVPFLQLFIRTIENVEQAILHYGLETGECSRCSRLLTNSHSILKGIGPVCNDY